jgi:pyridoxal 5'-phosphate synthase pdxS subunit
VAETGKLAVANFSTGGIATPADAALMRQLGAEAVFVGSSIFVRESRNCAEPEEAECRARAIERATTQFADAAILGEASAECQAAMKGVAVAALPLAEMLQDRGW